LQEYLKSQLIELAQRPSVPDVLIETADARRRTPPHLGTRFWRIGTADRR
jgi:hypothetical protein